MNVGDRVRVTEEGSPLTDLIGVLEELPSAASPHAPPETAFASVRFQGIVPTVWRCDLAVLEPAQ